MNPATSLRLSVAGLVATLLSAVTLAPLVRDYAWVVPVVIVVAVVVGTGAALRQLVRVWPVVALAQLLAFTLTVTALFVRDVAVWGVVPGPEAIGALNQLLQDGLALTREAAAPVPDRSGVVLMLVGGIGLVAVVVDVIAASLGRPAVAGLPLLAVYCVPAAVLPEGLDWQYFVVAAVGFLVLVAADAGDRVRSWGRVLGGTNPENGIAALGGPLSGARRVAAVSLAVAVVLPLVIPGLGERMLTSGNGLGPGKGTGKISVVNPILTLRQNLGARSKEPVIRYRTTVATPEPLRIVSDSEFTGEQWAPATGSISRRQRVQDGLAAPPGLTTAISTQQHETDVQIFNLKETYLPTPYPATRVEIDGDWLYEMGSLNIVGDGESTVGISYRVQHLAVNPTPAQLDAAAAPAASVVATYTKLPGQLPAVIRTTAQRIAGTGTPYQQAVRLQEWFRTGGGFVYDERPSGAGDDSGEDAIVAFLRGKRGYCVQFASAMAVMARTLGIPARVGVGFLPGKQVGAGTYEVSLQDAHAWPELYFEGVGWTRFEPTPAARVANVPSYTLGEEQQPAAAASPSASASAAPSASAELPDVAGRPFDPGADTAVPEPSLGERVPWRVLAVLAGLLLLLGVPKLASIGARRLRWGRARTAIGRAETAWDDLREQLGDLGIGWATSWTPRALQRRLGDDHDLSGSDRAALGRLVTDLESARYAPPTGLHGRDAEDQRRDVDLVVKAVAATCPPSARRRAALFPRSGLTALTRWGRRVDDVAERAGQRAGQRAAELGSEVRRTVGSGKR